MQKNLYLIIISFCLVSCYTYQVKKQADTTTDNKQDSKKSVTLADNTPMQAKNTTAASQSLSQQQMSVNIQEKLAPNKNVRIDVDGKTYKIIVDKWENDSLVAHAVHNPKKILKFHKNQINSEKIAEKRFSQPIADIITVAAYAGIGILIYSLVK
ncbi:hypothetical protein MQX03_05105 [Chryseobacterium aahli]|uniref:hypothetical protein n=1 Tax=Chryseobacterium aahli TaxID=1278643 RepID=UPI001F60CDDB|nr:hypothetical protein [Chryseobacterium aahli]MCI3936564.1 hypothetical protein [Chryseobacterium aahli]